MSKLPIISSLMGVGSSRLFLHTSLRIGKRYLIFIVLGSRALLALLFLLPIVIMSRSV